MISYPQEQLRNLYTNFQFEAVVGSTMDYVLFADLLIDFDMDIYEINETEGLFRIKVELTSQIEREIQLLLMTKDGKATGQTRVQSVWYMV